MSYPQPAPNAYYEDDDDTTPYKRKLQGAPCQWAYNGHGFVASGRTIKTLEAGAYSGEYIQNTFSLVPQQITTDNLVRLPDSKSDFVIAEIEKFWTLKALFKDLGFTHKRGFLLTGPPGSGKTSTISIVMADTIKRGGVVFLISRDQPQLWARTLLKFRQIEPDRECVVVLEDVDALVKEHSEAAVLAILDGEDTIDKCVFIATTNYPQELDKRMTDRPSRFDWVLEIGLPNEAARRAYLESRKLPEIDMDEWVAKSDGLSIAHLKELIVRVCAYGRNFEEEVCKLKGMKYVPGTPKPMGFGASA